MEILNLKKEILNTRGQIMIITLLVLTILTIIVVSVVAVVTKNSQQQLNSKLYEVYLDDAENQILNAIDSYAPITTELSAIQQSGCTSGTSTTTVLVLECSFQDSTKGIQSILEIRDEADLNEFPLLKDQTFQMNLQDPNGNYDDNLDITWTGKTSMAFSIDYVDEDLKYHSFRDIYDSAGLITSEQNIIAFGQPSNPTLQGVSFNLRNDVPILRDNSTFQPVGITFRPIILEEGSETLLTVKTVGFGIPQVRVYEATSYALNAETEFGETPAPTAITKVPLYPSMPALFDYVLLTQSKLRTNP